MKRSLPDMSVSAVWQRRFLFFQLFCNDGVVCFDCFDHGAFQYIEHLIAMAIARSDLGAAGARCMASVSIAGNAAHDIDSLKSVLYIKQLRVELYDAFAAMRSISERISSVPFVEQGSV